MHTQHQQPDIDLDAKLCHAATANKLKETATNLGMDLPEVCSRALWFASQPDEYKKQVGMAILQIEATEAREGKNDANATK